MRKITINKLVLIAVLTIASLNVKSQTFDQLIPDGSVFCDPDYHSDYKFQIRKRLLSNLSEFPIARTIVCRAFEPEFAVSIESQKKEDGRYDERKQYLILRTCRPSIWGYCSQQDRDSCIVHTQELLVDSVFVLTVGSLYKTALANSCFPSKSSVGLDGAFYYFVSSQMFYGAHCGFTWSPDLRSKMGALCHIAELMRTFCETKDRQIKDEIIRQSKELISRFKNENNAEKEIGHERYMWMAVCALLLLFVISLLFKMK